MRLLNKALFCLIAAEDENDNPRNILYIPLEIIFIFLALKQNSTLFKGLNMQRAQIINMGVQLVKKITFF
jgi:hypothetical protein